MSMRQPERPRVLILGAGFGGLWAARELAHAPAEVLVLDANNYHTFHPLLYQVAAAEVEPEEIVFPVRSVLQRNRNSRFLVDAVTGVDLASRRVRTLHHVFEYDYLILAVGSVTHFFGVPGAAEHAFPLKTLEQAIALRNHSLMRFERALCASGPEQRRRMLTFAIVGGGPTGVEYAGALSELIRGPLRKDYPQLDFHEVRVILLEATDRLLREFPERLQRYAADHLRRMGVELRLNSTVAEITPDAVRLKDDSSIDAQTVVWTAGTRVEPMAPEAGLPAARNGQIRVLPTLQLPGHPEAYAIGDMAWFEDRAAPLPMNAPVAIQQGRHAARNIRRRLRGEPPLPFQYRDLGKMVTIGRNAAVAQMGRRAFTGFPAWALWLGVHLFNLIGFRNRILVMVNWAWDYFLFERAVRLILPQPKEEPDIPEDGGRFWPAVRKD